METNTGQSLRGMMSNLSPIPSSKRLRSVADRVLGKREGVQTRLSVMSQKIKGLEAEGELLQLVSNVIRSLIDSEINDSVQAVEKLQSEGLRTVFDDQDLSVSASVETQRGKISVELLTSQKLADGTVIEGVSNDAFGGAITTVQSVLMRIIVILRRDMRPLLLLDESLPAFDANYVSNMADFLRALSERLGLDILLVSHNQSLVEGAHKAYQIKKVGGAAKFEVAR